MERRFRQIGPRVSVTNADGRRRLARGRRVRVRVETDGETYVGTLTLGCTLGEMLDDARAYLAVWNAALEGSDRVEEFVAIHKGAIRSVVVVAGEAGVELAGARG